MADIVLVPTSNQLVPSGTPTGNHNIVWTGPVNQGDTLTMSWSQAVPDAGVTHTDFDAGFTIAGTDTLLFWPDRYWNAGAVSSSWTAPGPYNVDCRLEGGGEPAGASHGTLIEFELVRTTNSNICQYGTEPQPSASVTTVVTPALVDLVLTAVDLEWLAPVFDVLWFSTLNVAQMCGALPPPLPPLDLSLLTAGQTTIQQLFTAVAWPYFCQCAPGTPNPVPPLPPSGSEPTGWPIQPTFNCSDSDLCAALAAMQQQLAAIQTQILNIGDLTTAIQRFRVPFAYVGGTQHQGLTGSGTISVSRLIGVQVIITALPASARILASQPDYVWDMGWISVSDGGGMLQQRRIARQSMTWLPDQAQEAILVGYFLQPDVQISIVELLPEP